MVLLSRRRGDCETQLVPERNGTTAHWRTSVLDIIPAEANMLASVASLGQHYLHHDGLRNLAPAPIFISDIVVALYHVSAAYIILTLAVEANYSA